MEFDKSRVYTALNADELKVCSKVIVADDLAHLKSFVKDNITPSTLKRVTDESRCYRFIINGDIGYPLAYLISEPEEKKLKWTDLVIGDIITDGKIKLMVTAVSPVSSLHIYAGLSWLTDKELEEWEKLDR